MWREEYSVYDEAKRSTDVWIESDLNDDELTIHTKIPYWKKANTENYVEPIK